MAADLSTSYGRIADRYEQERNGDFRAAQLADALQPWLPASGVVVDVGGGTGIVSRRLAAPGRTMIVADLSTAMIGQARKWGRLPGRLLAANSAALPLADDSVAAVTFTWVLHHVGHLEATVAECARVLRPGGRLISISARGVPPKDAIDPIISQLRRETAGDPSPAHPNLVPIAEAHGFALEHDAMTPVDTVTSPDDIAAAVEEKLFSHLWDLDDDQWARLVVPRLEELRALPDASTRRVRPFPHPITVLRRA